MMKTRSRWKGEEEGKKIATMATIRIRKKEK